MVQIWLKDPFPHGDPRLPHQTYPPKRLFPDELTKKTGACVWQIDVKNPVSMGKRITTLKLDRGFKREDIVIIDEKTTTNFQEKLDQLFSLSIRSQEEAKLVLEGEAYFDIHDMEEDKWIRVMVESGDLITIPKQTAFRFTTTPKNYVRMKRFFKDDPRG